MKKILFVLSLFANLAMADVYTPIARYKFENNHNDFTSNAYNLTDNGTIAYGSNSPTPKQGSFWTGPFVAGSNTYFLLPSGLRTAMQGASTYSVGGWVYKQSRIANTYIMSANDSGVFFIQYGDASADNVRFGANSVSLSYTFSGGVGSWHFILVVGKSNAMNIYVDGPASVASNASSAAIASSTVWKIGQFQNVATQSDILLDDWRFYNSDISASVLAGGGWPPDPTGRSLKLRDILNLKLGNFFNLFESPLLAYPDDQKAVSQIIKASKDIFVLVSTQTQTSKDLVSKVITATQTPTLTIAKTATITITATVTPTATPTK